MKQELAYLDDNASWSDAVDGSGNIIGSGEVNASDPGVYCSVTTIRMQPAMLPRPLRER
jgi:hypothetical protein